MKLKRAKLAAIAMTALMAVGAMSSFAYAEETDEASAVVETSTSVSGGFTVSDVKFAYTVEKIEQNSGTQYVVTNDSMEVTYTATYTTEGEDGKTYTWSQPETATATIYKQEAATCEEGAYTLLHVLIGDTFEYFSDKYYSSDALGHNWSETKRVTTLAPTDTTEGSATVYYTCTRCGETKTATIVLEPSEHEYSSTPTYVNLNNILVNETTGKPILDENGLPQLKVPTADGSYETIYYCVNNDGAYYSAGVTILLATEGSYAKITYVYGIATTSTYGIGADDLYAWESYSPTTDVPAINLNKIEMKNCSQDGYFIVTYYNNATDLKAISQEKVVVPAHHLETGVTIEFASADDADLLVVEYDKNGNLVITNQSCYLTASYYEVVHCCAEGCKNDWCLTKESLIADACLAKLEAYGGHDGLTVVSKTLKTKAPDGDHVINTVVKTDIDFLVKNNKTTVTSVDIENYITSYEKTNGNGSAYAKVVNDTSTCTEDGTVDVEYYCKVCGTLVKTVTYNVNAKGHDAEAPTRENYVAPTCTSTGSYDAVTYCSRCGEVIREVRSITIPRVKHTNELSVTSAGVGTKDTEDTLEADIINFTVSNTLIVDPADGLYLEYYAAYGSNGLNIADIDELATDVGAHIGNAGYPNSLGAYIYAVSECDVCGYQVQLNKDVEVYITSIEKENAKGEAGSITLKLVYKQYISATGKYKTCTKSVTLDYFSTLAAYQARTEASYTGLKYDSDGIYRYYVDSQFISYTGIVEYQGGSFYVVNGQLSDSSNGLTLVGDTFYFLANGQVQSQHEGLALYDGEWFYITDGELNTSINGLVDYDGGTFLFAAGRLASEVNGLWEDFDGTWYFLANGQVQSQYSGIASYDGAFFVVEDGKLDSDYNGTVTVDGVEFTVVNGQLY